LRFHIPAGAEPARLWCRQQHTGSNATLRLYLRRNCNLAYSRFNARRRGTGRPPSLDQSFDGSCRPGGLRSLAAGKSSKTFNNRPVPCAGETKPASSSAAPRDRAPSKSRSKP
jgi:hypothetical protein